MSTILHRYSLRTSGSQRDLTEPSWWLRRVARSPMLPKIGILPTMRRYAEQAARRCL